MTQYAIRNTHDVIVFDFDGTIVDSMSAFADIASQVMPKHLPIDASTARHLYFETSGLPFFQQLEVIFPGNPANKAAAEEFENAKGRDYLNKPLFRDVPETIEYLKGRGIKIAVSSNNFQYLVDQYVGRTGLKFDIVLGFKNGFAKGADHFSHVERSFKIRRSQITFVGDSLKDGERASDYGISFIGKEGIFTREQFAEKFPRSRVISTLLELKEIF